MTDEKSPVVKYLDYGIYGLTILFLGSLTNSIFVNQVGYFGALLLILVRIFVTRENKFKRLGIEIPVLLFILAEIISAFLSVTTSQAFHNVLKRVLLLPVIYFIPAAAENNDKAKIFFKVYISFALISALIYFIYSYQYLISGLLHISGSGPSIFQYPITTAELLSFTAIFLFAFLLNEKLQFRWKALISIGFLISIASLVLTYKRTGWLGLAAGIFIILLLKRKFLYIGAFTVLIGLVFFLSKETSRVHLFDINNGAEKLYTVETAGNAMNLLPSEDFFYTADYNNGLLKISNSGEILGSNKFQVPVKDILKWQNYYIVVGVDNRFVLFQPKSNEKPVEKEFLTKGYTRDYEVANGKFYVLDSDSGLTIFKDPDNLNNRVIYEQLVGYHTFSVDSNHLVLSNNGIELDSYKLENYIPVIQSKQSIKQNAAVDEFIVYSSLLFTVSNNNYTVYNLNDMTYNKVVEDIDNGIRFFREFGGKLYGVNDKGDISKISIKENDFIIQKEFSIGFVPTSLAASDSLLYASETSINRFKSIFDPYYPSNAVRFALWKAGWEIFLDNPLFGVGDIDLAKLYIQYKSKYDKEIQGHLHNNYIHLLATLGIFGFSAVMFLLGIIFVKNIKIYNKFKNTRFISSYSLGVIGCFVSFLVAGLTEWNFGDHEIITFVWFTIGLNFAFYYNNIDKKS